MPLNEEMQERLATQDDAAAEHIVARSRNDFINRLRRVAAGPPPEEGDVSWMSTSHDLVAAMFPESAVQRFDNYTSDEDRMTFLDELATWFEWWVGQQVADLPAVEENSDGPESSLVEAEALSS